MVKALQKKKKIRFEYFILLLIIFVLVVVLGTVLFYVRYTNYDTIKIDMLLRVGDHAGFDVNTSYLIFGMVPPGSASSRPILINHPEKVALKVNIIALGEIAPWITVSDNNFFVQPNQTKTIQVKATAPAGTKFGNYTGELVLKFKRKLL